MTVSKREENKYELYGVGWGEGRRSFMSLDITTPHGHGNMLLSVLAATRRDGSKKDEPGVRCLYY